MSKAKDQMTGKRVTVMGLGLHGGGVSVVRWFLKHGARVTVTDLKTKKELLPSLKRFKIQDSRFKIHFIFGKHRAEDFRDADLVVRNPAVPRDSPFLKIAQRHHVPIENEATLFFKHCKSKNIIGVTGTRGKSTTAAMIAVILQRSKETRKQRNNIYFAGNIRTTPMLSIVDRVKPEDWVVLELSSWHLENMDEQKISPHIAVVTNLLQDHLNRYSSMQSYARAKESIVRHQKKGDIAVLNRENAWTQAMGKRARARVYWFLNHESRIKNQEFFGEHNRANAEAAATAAQAIGTPLSVIRSALRTFHGLPDRLEYVRTVREVAYYNDTTATTPEATIAALKTLSCNKKQVTRNIVLIVGGSDKNLNYRPLIPWIKESCKAIVLLPGAATKKIKTLLQATSEKLQAIEASTMLSAVRQATQLAQRGDTVLLSPAAASFARPSKPWRRRGLFTHEFDRGDQFRKAVKKLR